VFFHAKLGKYMNYFDDLKVTYVGGYKSCENGSCLERHNFYGIGLMLGDGFLKRQWPDREITLKMPFVYLIRPSECGGAWITENGAKRDNRWFIVEGSRAERLVASLEEYSENPELTFTVENYSEMLVIHQEMLQLYHSVMPAKNYKLSVLAENFIAALYDALDVTNMQTPVYELIHKVIRLISENPGQVFDFENLAAAYNISYYHFRRRFVEFTGVPLHEFVLQKRFALAISLLKNKSKNIKEIADCCGFQNTSDFSRFIRKRSGFTPSVLKKQPQYMEV
jgi:AraC-like DNA-binding protein